MSLHESLYLEHLEEISLLYDQRCYVRRHALSWHHADDAEKRMEPHIDALTVGGVKARDICIERAATGDVGERFGALRALCRTKETWEPLQLISAFSLHDPNQFQGILDAFCLDLEKDKAPALMEDLLHMGGPMITLAAGIIAFRRLDYAPEIYEILQENLTNTSLAMTLLHTLGRIRPSYGAERVLNFLHSRDRQVVDAAITALVRLGQLPALHECMTFIGPGDWPKRSLGFYGGRHALTDSFFSVSELGDDEEGDQTGYVGQDDVMAPGLLGHCLAVNPLIDALNEPKLSGAAALSLFMITGADLKEEVFVTESVDPDELFDHERKRYDTGDLKEPKRKILRINQNPEAWNKWWKSHQINFDVKTRYRNGKPYSPEGLIQNLVSEQSPEMLRKLAAEELVIRYGIDVPFETNMTVQKQLRAIESLMIRLTGNPDGFEPGLWYYNGKPISDDEVLETTDTVSDDVVATD